MISVVTINENSKITLLPQLSLLITFFAIIAQILLNYVIDCPLDEKIRLSLLFVIPVYIYLISTSVRYAGILSPFTLFIGLSLLFYFGWHLVTLLNPAYFYESENSGFHNNILRERIIIQGTFVCVISMLVFHAGYFSYRNKSKQAQLLSSKKSSAKDLSSLKYIGWIVLIVSLYPTIKYLWAMFQLEVIYGYLGRRMLETEDNYLELLGIARWQITLAGLFLPSVYALMIAYKGKKYNLLLYGIILLYVVIYLLAGSRFMVLKILVCLSMIRFIWIKPIQKRDMFVLGTIALTLILAFSAIGKIRGSLDGELEESSSLTKMSDVFWETGITFTSIANVIQCCPSKVDYFYGKSVVGSVLQCLPSFLRFGFFDNNTLVVSSVFSPLYYGHDMNGYGSSFIAEAYYNFGYFMFIYIFFIGRLFNFLDKTAKKAAAQCNPYLFLFIITLSGELVYGVRNDLSSIPRLIMFSSGIVIIGAYFLKTISAKAL